MINKLGRPVAVGLVSCLLGFAVGLVPTESRADPEECEYFPQVHCSWLWPQQLEGPFGYCYSRSDGHVHDVYRGMVDPGVPEPEFVFCWQ
jgi:hypothetical protein